jgi:N,N'-diacetyllegionaminate synthase
MNKTYIIAEAGVNHNGNINIALELIIQAKNCGADCVKFQTYKTEQLVSEMSPKANYQLEVTDAKESQFKMLKKLELGYDSYPSLINKCKELNIDFLSTPYNFDDVDFLNSLNVDAFKIASGQLTELPFLKYVAKTGKKIIISTGMANLSDVCNAVEEIRNSGNNNIIVLQCTTNYPSGIEDANLKAMISMRDGLMVNVGYSDHTTGSYACYAAVALGAVLVEKHFTLDKNLEGPDHSTSFNPAEFSDLVIGIRMIEKAIGDGIKKPTKSEISNIYGMKRSLVVLRNINAGETLKFDDVGFKRPQNGLSPNYFDQVLGKKILKDMKKDDPILLELIDWNV